MKRILTLTVLLICVSKGFAQKYYADDDGNTEKRTIASFNSIEVSDNIDLFLTSSNQEELVVTASDEKYLDHLVTEVENNTLKIYYNNKGLNLNSNKRQLRAYVSYKMLLAIKGSGGSAVALENTLETSNVSLTFTGGATFTGGIEAEGIAVTQTGQSGVSISGRASKLNIETSNGALFKGYDFVADYCTAKATSGAVIRITINKELTARAKTGGGIRYKGNALVKDLDGNSGSAVKKGED